MSVTNKTYHILFIKSMIEQIAQGKPYQKNMNSVEPRIYYYLLFLITKTSLNKS